MTRFKVIKYRRKNEFRFAVIRKRLFKADELIVHTDSEEDARAMCARLNKGEAPDGLVTTVTQ